MRMEQLAYLIEINRHKSMNTASQVLHISPQGLSMSMSVLEEELELTLLEKSSRGVIVTPTGKSLVLLAETFFDGLAQLQNTTREVHAPESLKGVLDLYTPSPIIDNFLAISLGRIYKKYPDLSINVKELRYEDVIPLIKKKEIPFSFYYRMYLDGEDLLNDIPKNYTFVPIINAKYFCCVNKVHPLSKYSSVSLKEFFTYPFISHADSEYMILPIMQRLGMNPQLIRAQSINMMHEFLHNNVGVAFSAFTIMQKKNGLQNQNYVQHIPFQEKLTGQIGYIQPDSTVMSPSQYQIFTKIAAEFQVD